MEIDKNGEKEGVGLYLNNIAAIYVDQGFYDKAVLNLKASITIAEDLGAKNDQAIRISNLANIYGIWGIKQESIELFESALVLSD